MYIPKNKIVTNLLTQANQFVVKKTLKPYEGSYWKTHEGKYYTGKNPNDFNVRELSVKIQEIVQETENTTQIAYGDFQTPYESIEVGKYNVGLITEYAGLKKIDLEKIKVNKLPVLYHSSPSEDDYVVGSFTRYFVVKINENQYLEVDKETFEGIESKNPQWNWSYYQPFKLQWVLEGLEEEVFNINMKTTLIRQKKLKRLGLQSYLNNDYDRFWRP